MMFHEQLFICTCKECVEATLTPIDPKQTAVLELDELCSFVFNKGNKIWVSIALNREPQEVVAYACGDRSKKTYQILWDRIPSTYKKAMFFADYWEVYRAVIPNEQHFPVGKEDFLSAELSILS